MLCKKCGTTINPNGQFCVGCGMSVRDLRESGLIDETGTNPAEQKSYELDEPFVPKDKSFIDEQVEAQENRVMPPLQEITMEEAMPEDTQESNPQTELLNKLNNEANTQAEVSSEEYKEKPKKDKRKKSNKKSPFVIVLLLLLSIFSATAGVFLYLLGKPEKDVNQLLTYLQNKQYLSSILSEGAKNDSVLIKGDINITSKGEDTTQLTIDAELFIDYINKAVSINFNMDSEENFEAVAIGTEDSMYIYASNYLEKYIKVDLNETGYEDYYGELWDKNIEKSEIIDDINNKKNKIIEIISSSLTKDDFTQTIEKIRVKDKSVYTKKITLNITEKTEKNIKEKLIAYLITLSDGTTEEEIKTNIDEAIYQLISLSGTDIDLEQDISLKDLDLSIYESIFKKDVLKIQYGQYSIDISDKKDIAINYTKENYDINIKLSDTILSIVVDSDDLSYNIIFNIETNISKDIDIPNEDEVYTEEELENITLSDILPFGSSYVSDETVGFDSVFEDTFIDMAKSLYTQAEKEYMKSQIEGTIYKVFCYDGKEAPADATYKNIPISASNNTQYKILFSDDNIITDFEILNDSYYLKESNKKGVNIASLLTENIKESGNHKITCD